MKLSTLVAYKNSLERFNVADIQRMSSDKLQEILFEVKTQDLELAVSNENFDPALDLINRGFEDFNQTLCLLRDTVDAAIESVQKGYFAASYRMYENEMTRESVQWILDRKMPMSDETKMILEGRIRAKTDWRYPGLIIRPGRETFVKDMVDLDPLYLVDREPDLLEPALAHFPIEYQRRLRTYSYNEDAEQYLEKIPNNQFGLCLVFNFFNFKPFEVIKQYLDEIYQKLRPGGVLLMTINDCDRAHCVALCEANFTCYTPGGMVRDLAGTLGFEHEFSWHDKGNLSWVELRKPGELKGLRGGQTLAKIISKDVGNSK